MSDLPRSQTYASYRDKPGGTRRWLAIGHSDTERLIARLQLKAGGKCDIRIRSGKPQGPVRLRRRVY